MSSPGLRLTALGGTLSLFVLGLVAPAYAEGGGSLQDCMDQSINHNGQPPTCTQVDGTWVPSWPDDNAGFVGGFVVFAVLLVLVGIAATWWRVSTARRLATQSGMDPNLATQMTLLDDDGLSATYLAASLRQPSPTEAAAPAPVEAPPTAASRLGELKSLMDAGLITQAEYDERRQAIIDAV